MSKLTVIKSKEPEYRTESKQKLRVCAYCRVSTDKLDQRNSLEAQQSFFESIFKKNEHWTNVGIFADEGLSGTSLEKRDEFLKMLKLALGGGVDIILTKEVSRFSRNATDFLGIVRELHEKGVYIWFLSDNINTENKADIQKLSEYAVAAQGESIRTSTRVKWGQAESMKNGVVFGRKEMFGYNIKKTESGEQYFEIIEDEAETVKKIFTWFSEGDGTHSIAKKLREAGIKTKRYKNGWSNTVILRILRNEKYVGDLAQGKTYTPDPLSHKKKYNRGESDIYYIEDHHQSERIIDRELWNKVQRILEEKSPDDETKAKHSNRYWTSGKIYCGICNGRYVSYNKKQVNGKYKAWVCFKNHAHGNKKQMEIGGELVTVGCDGKRVNDKVLMMAIHDIIHQIIIPNTDEICVRIAKEFEAMNKPENFTRKIQTKEKAIIKKEEEIALLTEKHIIGEIPLSAYTVTFNKINRDLEQLKKDLTKLNEANRNSVNPAKLAKENIKQVRKLASLSDDEFNVNLYERILKKIIVFPDNILEIHLSFLPFSIKLKYTTSGRGKNYSADFTVVK